MIEITAISNTEKFICYKIKKSNDFYHFFLGLFKEFEGEIPDIQDNMGNNPNIFEKEDSYSYFDNENFEIIQFIGKDYVFLFIKTNQKEKLNQYVKKNSEFIS